jgi:hypothetical protein
MIPLAGWESPPKLLAVGKAKLRNDVDDTVGREAYSQSVPTARCRSPRRYGNEEHGIRMHNPHGRYGRTRYLLYADNLKPIWCWE